MPLTLTETDEFAAEVVGTMDGDAANYGTFNRAPTTNASRTRYLYNRSVPAKGGTLPLQLWTPIINESSTWALALNGASPNTPQ